MKPLGDYVFNFDVENADKETLLEAISFEESYSYLYGHKVIVNIEDVKKRLKEFIE
jgi:hypothetical protein